MSVITLIIFGALAAIVLFQLYSVLGRRVGRQPEDATAVPPSAAPVKAQDAALLLAEEGVALTGLAAIKSKDPSESCAPHDSGYLAMASAYSASGEANALLRS